MSVSISITDQDVFTALVNFLAQFLPGGTPVIQLQDNAVPMPTTAFVGMNNVTSRRLETNSATYAPGSSNPGTKAILAPEEYMVALDFYGPSSAEWARMCQALFRDDFATSNFPTGIAPLYADDPMQIPLISGEANYEQRWRLNAVMQVNAVTTVNQDQATALQAELVSVERKYPA